MQLDIIAVTFEHAWATVFDQGLLVDGDSVNCGADTGHIMYLICGL